MLSLTPIYAFAALLCFLGYVHHRRAQRHELQKVLQQYMPIEDPSSIRNMSVLV